MKHEYWIIFCWGWGEFDRGNDARNMCSAFHRLETRLRSRSVLLDWPLKEMAAQGQIAHKVLSYGEADNSSRGKLSFFQSSKKGQKSPKLSKQTWNHMKFGPYSDSKFEVISDLQGSFGGCSG